MTFVLHFHAQTLSDAREDGHRKDHYVPSTRVPRERPCAYLVLPYFHRIDGDGVQGLRRNMEMVIEFMMDNDGRGVKRIYPTFEPIVCLPVDSH